MEGIVKFFRDDISGFYYFVYAGILLFFIFAIIGYLVTEKYIPTSSIEKKNNEKNKKKVLESPMAEQVVQQSNTSQPVVSNQQILPQTQQQVANTQPVVNQAVQNVSVQQATVSQSSAQSIQPPTTG